MMTWILRNIALAVGMALVRYVLRVAKRRRAARNVTRPGGTARSGGVETA